MKATRPLALRIEFSEPGQKQIVSIYHGRLGYRQERFHHFGALGLGQGRMRRVNLLCYVGLGQCHD